MVTKHTGRPTGRPKLALRNDPHRYLLAYYEAVARINSCNPAFSKRQLALSIAMVWQGELVNEPDNVRNWTNGSGPVAFRAKKFRGREGSKNPRETSAFHPVADDIARKARRLSLFEGSRDDTAWWVGMVASWAVSLREPNFMQAQYPIVWCRLIGEYTFQQRVLARFVEARFGGRPLPSFTLPDFIPHDGS